MRVFQAIRHWFSRRWWQLIVRTAETPFRFRIALLEELNRSNEEELLVARDLLHEWIRATQARRLAGAKASTQDYRRALATEERLVEASKEWVEELTYIDTFG